MSRFSFSIDGPRQRQQAIAVGLWVLMVVVGAFLVWWGFFGPEPGAGSSSPIPTPTETPGLIPLATVAVPSPQAGSNPEPTVPLEEEAFGYGIQVHGFVGDQGYTMGQVEGLGLGWIKQQVRWDYIESTQGQMDWVLLDAVVNAANDHGLRVMLSVVRAPDWTRTYFDDNVEGAPPDDLSHFTDFLGRLVDRYRGRIHAIEVWNEQNLDREWDTAEGVTSSRYVEMLQMAYQAIKSRDPNVIVISGALSPVGGSGIDPNDPSRSIWVDDFRYFQEMVAHGFLSYCDCVGVHHNGYNIPPDVAWDSSYEDDSAVFDGFWDNPHTSWSFHSTLWLYHDTISGMKPLCVTEFGWASSEGLGDPPQNFAFAQDNTLEEQAEFIVQAYQLMREWGFVRLAFLWNLDFANKLRLDSAEDPYGIYSIIDRNGAPRLAYLAIAGMEKP